MTKLNQVYQCSLCGNIVEVVYASAGQLVCCGQPMNLLEENTVDAAVEKHKPVIEKVEGAFLVKVGSVAHPMVDDHYIEFIELITPNRVYRKNLQPGDAPEAKFVIEADAVMARAFCNKHGLWQGE